MADRVYLKEATRKNWNAKQVNSSGYPGDKNIELGCLMRIADATEAMATNYHKLQTDLDMYKRWYEAERAANKTLGKRIAALKGVINKLKNN